MSTLTKKQLKKWDLKFHELIMGKPSFDILDVESDSLQTDVYRLYCPQNHIYQCQA